MAEYFKESSRKASGVSAKLVEYVRKRTEKAFCALENIEVLFCKKYIYLILKRASIFLSYCICVFITIYSHYLSTF